MRPVEGGDLRTLPIVSGLKLLFVAVCVVFFTVLTAPQWLSSSVTVMTIFSKKIVNNQNHVSHKLLPEQSTHDYYLRPRSHDRSLGVKTDTNNFLSRLLFNDMY